eukprot:806534-Pyramimonas_sp.AAC.1
MAALASDLALGALDPATRLQAAGPGVGLEHLADPRKANGAELVEDPHGGPGGPHANPTRDFCGGGRGSLRSAAHEQSEPYLPPIEIAG